MECTNFRLANVARPVKNAGTCSFSGKEEPKETALILLQQLQVAAFAVRRPRGFLDIPEELPEVLFSGGIHALEANANASSRTAARDDSSQRQTLNPDLAARDPKSDFDFGAAADMAGGLHLASAHAGV